MYMHIHTHSHTHTHTHTHVHIYTHTHAYIYASGCEHTQWGGWEISHPPTPGGREKSIVWEGMKEKASKNGWVEGGV